MSELEIPDRALRVACDVYDAELTRDVDDDERSLRECAEKQAVRAAAPIIVAAELRRLLREGMPPSDEAFQIFRMIEQRAAELDPERNTT